MFRIFSTSSLVPLVVNCLAGAGIIAALYLWLKKHEVSSVAQALIMILAICLTPIPLLIISGMEHTLQCLFSFLFLYYFADWLEKNASQKRRLPFSLLLYALLTASIRYEGLFLVGMACVLLLAHRKLVNAVLLLAVALMPLLLFGLISVYNGNYFLPNSVLVKSQAFGHTGIVGTVYRIFFEKLMLAENGMASLATQRLALLIPLLYFMFRRWMRPSYRFILIALFGCVVLQLALAATGYLYRYEAYLFFCFLVITPLLFYHYGRFLLAGLDSFFSRMLALAFVFFLLFPVILRAASGMEKARQACINIYEQQYQMAEFVRLYDNKGVVALNDIGAVSYFTDAKVVDLWGLADIEVTKSKKNGYWTPAFIDSFSRARGANMAVIYDVWFTDSLTSKWSKVASWQIQNNVICGDDVVSFYAIDPAARDSMAVRLKQFEARLPRSVAVRYY